MLRALLEHGVRPDVVVGTSVGALNGAAIAADPTLDMVRRLRGCVARRRRGQDLRWVAPRRRRAISSGARTHMHSNQALRDADRQPGRRRRRIEELAVPFQCVAASIERAAEHWFSTARSPTRCSRPRRYPACCRRWRSAASTSSTAAS